ncbi:MAG: GMC family oxidoreductase [Gemmatimonadota bacterium]|nr:GMC family oxidoreductase [Gemmatimonadota bacterium]
MESHLSQLYDAIVIGSGITGGWAAKELTERGLRTLVLEAGGPVDPATDYVEHVQPWQLPFRGWGDRALLNRTQAVQQQCYACDEWSGKFFVNDLENPYTTPDDKPFAWIRGRQVGGRSIMWGRQVYRWSDLDFEANARDGHGVDWPIRYRDLAPWYDHVERFIGVCGQAEGLAQLPDSIFLPPMALNCVEAAARERLHAAFGGERVLTIGRAAILTRDHGGRKACHYCGPCERGCITGSYFSSLSATLPAARATGRLTLRPYSVVSAVLRDPVTGRASGVRVIDAQSLEVREFRTRLVFVCASALESARLLLLSGIGQDSGELGHNLMDHHMGAGARATMPGFEDHVTFGDRPNGIYIPRYRNVNDAHPDFVRGYAFQGGAGRGGWDRSLPGFGAGFKHALLHERGPWGLSFYGFGECLPRHDNQVELDASLTDRWGIPALRISCTYGDNERAQRKDMQVTAAEMLEASGAVDIQPYDDEALPGLVIHEMGTARMGRDPSTSVVNGWNQVWDTPNVYVTDGACMASSANQNPSLTYMALTARAAAHAVEAMKRREL